MKTGIGRQGLRAAARGIRSPRRGRRGITFVYALFLFTVCVAFVSLGVDWGLVLLTSNQLDTASDAAARAGVLQLAHGVSNVRSVAATWAAYNSANGSSVVVDTVNDIDFGQFNPSTRVFTALSSTTLGKANAIRVWGRRTKAKSNATSLPFAATFGYKTCNVSGSAVALPGTTVINYVGGFGTGGASIAHNGSAYITGSTLRVNDSASSWEAGSAFYNQKVNITNFSTTFVFQLVSGGGSGITFCIQNQGTTALGSPGSGLGFGTNGSYTAKITSAVCLKFDPYDSVGEGDDSIGIFTNGAPPTLPCTNLNSTVIDLGNGDVFAINLSYKSTDNILYVHIWDCTTGAEYTTTYTVNIPSIIGANTGYVGFTGGSGALPAEYNQDVTSWWLGTGAPTTVR